MYCPKCRAQGAGADKFCRACGAVLTSIPLQKTQAQESRRRRPPAFRAILWIVGILFGLSLLHVILSGSGSNTEQGNSAAEQSGPGYAASQQSQTPAAAPAAQGSSPTVGVEAETPAQTPATRPRDSGLATTAYEILKNPFQNPDQMVTLDVAMVPQLLNGTLQRYFPLPNPELAAATGYQALRFNRMLAPDQALYDIYGQKIDTGNEAALEAGPHPELLGQVVVVIMPGSLQGESRPDTSSDWDIQPAGTGSGTNAFGAAITVPVVKFWGYAQSPPVEPAPSATQAPAQETSTATQTTGSEEPNPGGLTSPSKSAAQAAPSSTLGPTSGTQTLTPPAALQTEPPANPASIPAESTPQVSQPATIEIPVGTTVEVLTSNPIASDVNRTGDIFRGSLGAPITIRGQVVVPKGTGIFLRALQILSPHHRGELTEIRLVLDHLDYGGRSHPLDSSSYDLTGPSGKRIQVSPGTTIQFQLLGPVSLAGKSGSKKSE